MKCTDLFNTFGVSTSLMNLDRKKPLISYRPGDIAYTFSRGSAAYFTNESGELEMAGSGVLRDSNFVEIYNGETLRTTLLEGQRTNSQTYSEEFDNVTWEKSFVTVTADVIEAPDGTVSADMISEATSSEYKSIAASYAVLSVNSSQAASFYAKAGTRNWISFATYDSSNGYRHSFVNLETGATGSIDEGHTVRVIPAANSFYRIEVSWTHSSEATTAAEFHIGTASGDGVYTHDGDITKNIYVWGCSIEINRPFSSSYIKTTNSPVVKSADVLKISGNSFSPGPCTIYLKFIELGSIIDGVNGMLFSARDSATAGTYVYVSAWSGIPHSYLMQSAINNTGVVSSRVPTAIPSMGDLVEIRAVIHSNRQLQLFVTINGGEEVAGDKSVGSISAFPEKWSNEISLGMGIVASQVAYYAINRVMAFSGLVELDECRERSL
jgi:hypothetical protein